MLFLVRFIAFLFALPFLVIAFFWSGFIRRFFWVIPRLFLNALFLKNTHYRKILIPSFIVLFLVLYGAFVALHNTNAISHPFSNFVYRSDDLVKDMQSFIGLRSQNNVLYIETTKEFKKHSSAQKEQLRQASASSRRYYFHNNSSIYPNYYDILKPSTEYRLPSNSFDAKMSLYQRGLATNHKTIRSYHSRANIRTTFMRTHTTTPLSHMFPYEKPLDRNTSYAFSSSLAYGLSFFGTYSNGLMTNFWGGILLIVIYAGVMFLLSLVFTFFLKKFTKSI